MGKTVQQTGVGLLASLRQNCPAPAAAPTLHEKAIRRLRQKSSDPQGLWEETLPYLRKTFGLDLLLSINSLFANSNNWLGDDPEGHRKALLQLVEFLPPTCDGQQLALDYDKHVVITGLDPRSDKIMDWIPPDTYRADLIASCLKAIGEGRDLDEIGRVHRSSFQRGANDADEEGSVSLNQQQWVDYHVDVAELVNDSGRILPAALVRAKINLDNDGGRSIGLYVSDQVEAILRLADQQ